MRTGKIEQFLECGLWKSAGHRKLHQDFWTCWGNGWWIWMIKSYCRVGVAGRTRSSVFARLSWQRLQQSISIIAGGSRLMIPGHPSRGTKISRRLILGGLFCRDWRQEAARRSQEHGTRRHGTSLKHLMETRRWHRQVHTLRTFRHKQ